MKYPDYHKDVVLIIRQTGEKVTGLYHKIHNLQNEVQQLREEVKRSNTLFLALLRDPQAQHELEAIARELRIQTYKKP